MKVLASPEAVGDRQQAAAARPAGAGRPERLEDCRQDVDVTDRGVHDPRSQERRVVEDQRNLERRLVGKDPMRRFAVISERLAVIRGHDDERVGSSPLSRMGCSSGTERRIGRGHFSAYGSRGKGGSANGSGGA